MLGAERTCNCNTEILEVEPDLGAFMWNRMGPSAEVMALMVIFYGFDEFFNGSLAKEGAREMREHTTTITPIRQKADRRTNGVRAYA